jgi:hypothetical protein
MSKIELLQPRSLLRIIQGRQITACPIDMRLKREENLRDPKHGRMK